ncbi:MAG: cyclic pyranopterin monophosphate synthase MoaC [Planctomycetota bacterium]
MKRRLTHLDRSGRAHMVDVGAKRVTQRMAVAEAVVHMRPETLRLVLAGGIKKGDAFAVSRLAGIMAAKQVPAIIPLCHAISLTSVAVDLKPEPPGAVRITATARASDKTGVEMEALTAAAVAALSLYDMAKAVDREMTIDSLRLLEKAGGRSGHFKRKRS